MWRRACVNATEQEQASTRKEVSGVERGLSKRGGNEVAQEKLREQQALEHRCCPNPAPARRLNRNASRNDDDRSDEKASEGCREVRLEAHEAERIESLARKY
jgi:hypothetical protein